MTGDITYQGTVNAQGDVSAKGGNGGIFTGKIQSGQLSGGMTLGGFGCVISSVWRKQ
jgi:hypothetical protein